MVERTLNSSSSLPSAELSAVGADGERIGQLLEKVSSLEELIGNADAHFEQEVERLRQELDEDYQTKLKSELEREEVERQHLIRVIEELKSQLRGDGSETSSLCDGHEASDFHFMSTSIDQLGKAASRSKYLKVKEELELKEKEMETVSQAYRTKINDLQENYNCGLKQMEQKYQADVARIKQELNENYKQVGVAVFLKCLGLGSWQITCKF